MHDPVIPIDDPIIPINHLMHATGYTRCYASDYTKPPGGI